MGCHTWFYRKGFKSEKEMPIRRKVKGNWYVEDTKRPIPLKTQWGEVEYYHDLFRIGGYFEITLHSEKECEQFIKNKKIKEVNWKDLKEFWKVYPDGMICFG
jgi:hypothetical protein